MGQVEEISLVNHLSVYATPSVPRVDISPVYIELRYFLVYLESFSGYSELTMYRSSFHLYSFDTLMVTNIYIKHHGYDRRLER